MSGFAEQARQALVSAKWTHRRTYLLEVRRMKKKKKWRQGRGRLESEGKGA